MSTTIMMREAFCNSLAMVVVELAWLKFALIVERDEDGYYVASVPELPGCHTQAKKLDELEARVREAIEAYLGASRY